ncbi:MAG TPA: hypothetical protein VNT81_01780 [Vicinamibacterales bacterium]|nr:hypothetical protein [Vicinamibacterales bacterium]
MRTSQQHLADMVGTLTPALRQRQNVPTRFTGRQKRDLARASGWNRDRNIVGFGIGPKRVNDKPDYKHPSLVVFVLKKVAESRLPREQRIPKRLDAESVDRRVLTDVVEVGTIPVFQALRPGTNAAHFTMRSGSVTAVVVSPHDPQRRALLSCCHVFAPPGAAGAHVESPPDPSSLSATNLVAMVTEAQLLQPGGNIVNKIDAALAEPIAGAPPLSNTIAGVGTLTSISSLRSGQFIPSGIKRVLGIGAISGAVSGEIIAERVATLMADAAGRSYLFADLVAYRPSPVTQGGDSGMPIVRQTPAGLELLGMHIGLGQILSTPVHAAFFVPLAAVRDRFAIELA